jgi:methyl-accepting chemotaxis protein
MDEVTQQNAALVEQAAAAAQSLQEQSGRLVETVSIFKLSSHETPRAQPAQARAAQAGQQATAAAPAAPAKAAVAAPAPAPKALPAKPAASAGARAAARRRQPMKGIRTILN